MISKELLSEVSGQECLYVKVDELTGKTVYQYMTPVERIPWNIYELAHKCKEWAFDKCLLLNSGLYADRFYEKHIGVAVLPNVDKTLYADTEPEAIFKACQWILDNKDKQ